MSDGSLAHGTRETAHGVAGTAHGGGSATLRWVSWAGWAGSGVEGRLAPIPLIAGFSSWAVMTIGLMGLFIGSGLFALVTWRVRTLSRAAAAALGFGAITMIAALTGTAGGLVPSTFGPVLMSATVLAFSGGWAGLGISALRVSGPVSTTPEGASL